MNASMTNSYAYYSEVLSLSFNSYCFITWDKTDSYYSASNLQVESAISSSTACILYLPRTRGVLTRGGTVRMSYLPFGLFLSFKIYG